jgi:hypothetical protein
MKYEHVLPSLRERSRPSDEAVRRVRLRLDRQLVPAKAELSHLPSPDAAAAARVSARLRAHRRPSAAPWWALGLGALAFAAVAGGVWRASTAPGVGDLVERDGRGTLTQRGDRLEIDWEYGHLAVGAVADRVVEVRTPEGTAEADGALTVDRDALGTRFTGRATVTCAGEPPTDVTGEATCLPVTLAGWLNRARALAERGAPPAELAAEVDRALAADGQGPERGELWALRTNALLADGRSAEALQSAEQALASGVDPARALSLRRTAARIALTLGDCARALPHLDALPDLDAQEAAHRDRCRAR